MVLYSKKNLLKFVLIVMSIVLIEMLNLNYKIL